MDIQFLNLTTPSNKEVSPALERINKIKEYGRRKEEERQNEKNKAELELCKALDNIKKLSERISILIRTANECKTYGINISSFTDDTRPVPTLNEVERGIISGIALKNFDEWDLYVYPDCLMVKNNNGTKKGVGLSDIISLKKFVEDFDDFETCFYAYVDKVIE